MKSLIKILFFLFLFTSLNLQAKEKEDFTLREKIAQMLIMGFRGTDSRSADIVDEIKEQKIGGIILFEYDAPSKSRPRNITSSEQLEKLVRDLKRMSSVPLFVSIDQEGGKVNRLKSDYGFPAFPSPEYIGKVNNDDTTLYWAKKTGEILYNLGFNLNFAPCADVNINPNCPVIGKLGRSFSSNPEIVTKHAKLWIQGQTEEGILSSIKHFPGHGSSSTDTHLQFTDITATWDSVAELQPYKKLIADGECDFIMSSHVMNRNLDTVPATLSRKVITGILRNQLGYKGIIISDDMDMGAIKNNYSLSIALEKGLDAGIDIFIFSNNGKEYNPRLTEDIISTIEKLVKEKVITEERIDESFQRIMAVKKRL